jgi:antitoxin VapB
MRLRTAYMALEINSVKASNLASQLAAATGEDVDTAVVRAIEERLVRVTRQAPLAKDDELDHLFDKLAQMPVLDARSPDEIVGYGPDGLPD